MQWSMPRPLLQVVAALIGLIAVGSLVTGFRGVPARGRLPGERAVDDNGAAPIEATEATPLLDQRIEGPPPPTPLSDEEKAKLAAEKKAREEADAAKLAAAEAAKPAAGPAAPAPPADKVGDLLDSVTPPPEEPPH